MAAGQTTTDHHTIKRWIEQRGGKPSVVTATHKKGEGGILRVDFPSDGRDEGLEPVGWEQFFRTFDDNDLAFLYQDKTADGKESRFFKFVERGSSKH